jgi:8-oxo-dGTP pyrophosphatase MutT (NUDIX family)
MELSANVFDAWVYRRTAAEIEYLLLYTSEKKADRYFNAGRFWQIPSDAIHAGETLVSAIARRLSEFGLVASSIWAAEHTYAIYNRRFDCMQLIGVYAAEVNADGVRLDPDEHSEYRWCSFDQALALVHYRGLKDGLRSTLEYITGTPSPARELRLL